MDTWRVGLGDDVEHSDIHRRLIRGNTNDQWPLELNLVVAVGHAYVGPACVVALVQPRKVQINADFAEVVNLGEIHEGLPHEVPIAGALKRDTAVVLLQLRLSR